MAEWTDLGRVRQWSLRVGPSLSPPPTEPNRWIEGGGREFLWLGPDEWLVVGEEPESLGSIHNSIVDVSSNRRVLELTGDDRFELLSKGCGLDLHPSSWRSGMCAQTLLAHVQVILQERQGATRVFVRSSFAGHLADWLGVVA